MGEELLEMRGITKRFGGITALEGVDFTVRRGEIHALVGENGAGKSTLMNILSGLHPHKSYEGQVLLRGEECRFGSICDSEARGIVVIHQELALVPYLSVAENIFLNNRRFHRGPVVHWDRMRDEARAMLGKVGLEGEDVSIPVARLGVGKQQLVEIAKALAKEVDVLVLDEPTSALNDEESNLLLELLCRLREQGVTSILISHKLHEVTRVADAVTVLRDGHTIETLRDPGDIADEDRIVRGMVGRDVAQRFPQRDAAVGEVLFEVEHWTVDAPGASGRRVVNDVSLQVRRGEVVGIAGLMGSGRTELAMSLFGRSYGRVVRGAMRKEGRTIEPRTARQAIREGIAYMTEDRKTYGLVLFNSIRWNVSLPNLGRLSRRGVIDRNAERAESEEAARKTRIKASGVDQVVGNLSGGNQQKVVLSKWISTRPDLLILDEPTRGIDVLAKYEIYGIVNELAAEGKGVLLISSDMTELLGMADRIVVLCEGEVAGEFPRGEASQERIMKSIIEHGRRSGA